MYRKYYSHLNSHVSTIFAGEYYVSSKGEIISTVLGSCIAVCLFDRENKIGGMNHFMLPDSHQKSKLHLLESKLRDEELCQKEMRYGIVSMEVLIAQMIKLGAERKNISAKIFGGGKVLNSNSNITSIGERNIGFTKAFLKTEGIAIQKEDTGAYYGRKIFFLTINNSVFVKKVGIDTQLSEERRFKMQLEKLRDNETDITIF